MSDSGMKANGMNTNQRHRVCSHAATAAAIIII